MNAPSKNYGMTAVEAMNSLNGFDEIAIEKAFGQDFDDLNGRATVRAVIFVLEKRAGASDKDAKQYAMSVPMGQLDDHFESNPEEVDEDEPETEQGKDSSADG
ncbi:hypothetical protein [Nocardioides sp. J54]|uniref:hypothetical protein n=1 Tax=Nocardioides sp. J54 TaxID=935866 RepID=UPI00048D7B39|nr:hypothetical protein [Nocardioides sp. J54]